MDQSALRGMPKVSTGKSTPAARVTPSSLEVCVEAAPRIALAPTLKMSVEKLHDPRVTSEFGRGVLHPQLVKELYMMSSEVLMAQSAKQIILWASDLQVDKEKLIAQLVEVTNRLELSDRDLNDTRADLSEAQRELKEQWASRRKADNDLLNAIRELET
ncbi:hypothetical protein BHM03_00026211 [Ensete ventricosum]|nr:hypothetical protein BHM03_00026211 [Ensete ventricosum]